MSARGAGLLAPTVGGISLDIAAPPAERPATRAWTAPRWLLREEVLSLVLVLVVASALRLPFPDLTPFGHDEALEAERARPIWYGARPVESEVTSWWIPDPAGLLYVFALAEPFPQPAVARVVLVSLLNVLSVLICYLLARRFFGAQVGLVSGLLYAVNPWAVTFGRQPWVITQPLLTTIMLLTASMVVARRDGRWIVPFFLAGAAQTQTHLLAVLFGPPVLLTLLLFWPRWLKPALGPAVLAALAVVTPYALHLWSIRDEIAEALAKGNRGLVLAPDSFAPTLTAWLISGFNLDKKIGFPDAAMDALRIPLLVVAGITVALLLTGIVVSALACRRRAADWEADALLLIWLLAPLALMTWQTSQVYIHYVLCLVPVPFVLMARGAAWLADCAQAVRLPTSLGWRLVGGVLAGVLLVQVASVAAFYAAIDRMASLPPSNLSPTDVQAAYNRADLAARQIGIGELHGPPLRVWQRLADQVRFAANGVGLQNITVMTGIQDEGNRHLDRRRKALSYLLGPDLHPRFPLEGLVVVPTQGDSLTMTLPEEELPRAASRGAVRLLDVPLAGTNGATRLWRTRPRAPSELIPQRFAEDAPLAPGVRLVGVDTPTRAQPGQTIPLILFLLVEPGAHDLDPDLLPFVELTDTSGGTRLTSTSRGGLPSSEWLPGDLLIQRINLTVPVRSAPATYQIRVGVLDGVLDSVPAAPLRVAAQP